MEHSKAYRCINYLSTLRGASPTDRKTMLQNVTRLQMASITETIGQRNNQSSKKGCTALRKETSNTTNISVQHSKLREKKGISETEFCALAIYVEKLLPDSNHT